MDGMKVSELGLDWRGQTELRLGVQYAARRPHWSGVTPLFQNLLGSLVPAKQTADWHMKPTPEWPLLVFTKLISSVSFPFLHLNWRPLIFPNMASAFISSLTRADRPFECVTHPVSTLSLGSPPWAFLSCMLVISPSCLSLTLWHTHALSPSHACFSLSPLNTCCSLFMLPSGLYP